MKSFVLQLSVRSSVAPVFTPKLLMSWHLVLAITLTGFVHSFAQKRIAERAAKSVCGVVSVTNDIEVQPSTRTDPEIAREVRHVLKSNAIVSEFNIKATVHQGVVTLDGTVESNCQKLSAADAVMGVHGVLSVVDLIMVKPQLCPRSSRVQSKLLLKGMQILMRKTSMLPSITAP